MLDMSYWEFIQFIWDTPETKVIVLVSIHLFFLGFIILLFLKKVEKPALCKVCALATKDGYREHGSKNAMTPLCRNHLVDRWSTDVQAVSENMVVIEPDVVKYPWTYVFGDLQELKKWNYSKASQENIDLILNTISGRFCDMCRNPASVAYFKKEAYTFPDMDKLTSPTSYFCKPCVTKTMGPILQTAKTDFVEGVDAPHNARGVYHSQEI